MIRVPILRYQLLILFSSVLLAASVKAEPVKLAVLLPNSGVFSDTGRFAKKGFLLGVQTEAADQNVKWEPWVKFEFSDTRNDRDHSLKLAKAAIANGSKAILGLTSSKVTLHLRDYVLDEARVPLIIFGGAVASKIRRKHPLFLRLSLDAQQTMLPLAQWLKMHPIVSAAKPRWACIYLDYSYGVSLCDGFKAGYQDIGEEIGRIPMPFKTLNKKKQIVELTKLKPDFAVAGVSGAEGIVFVRDYYRFKVHEKIPLIMTKSAFRSNRLTKHAKTLEEYGTGVGVLNGHIYNPAVENAENQRFRTLYQKAHKTLPTDNAMYSYDAGRLLVKALVALEGKWNGAKVIELMKTLPYKSPRHSDPLKFDSHGDVINSGYIFRVKREGNQLVNEVIGSVPPMNMDDYQK